MYTASNTDNCFSLRTSPTFLRHGFLLYDEYFTKKSRYFSIYFFREVENYNVEDSSYLIFLTFCLIHTSASILANSRLSFWTRDLQCPTSDLKMSRSYLLPVEHAEFTEKKEN